MAAKLESSGECVRIVIKHMIVAFSTRWLTPWLTERNICLTLNGFDSEREPLGLIPMLPLGVQSAAKSSSLLKKRLSP